MQQFSMTQIALLCFVAIFVFLVIQILVFRSVLTLGKIKEINCFSPQGDDYTPYYHRLTRAHANMYENTPIWLGILGFAIIVGKESVTNGFALYFFGARLGQVGVHLWSVAPWAIYVRFVCFTTQVLIASYWLYELLSDV